MAGKIICVMCGRVVPSPNMPDGHTTRSVCSNKVCLIAWDEYDPDVINMTPMEYRAYVAEMMENEDTDPAINAKGGIA